MAREKQICGLCAWRRDCQKRFRITSDVFLGVNCADYTRDLTIKDTEANDLLNKQEVMDKMVNDQVEKWRAMLRQGARRGLELNKITGGPVITISREPGSGGSEIARRLSKALNMDLIGSQIIQHVADSAKMSRKVIESFDEKDVKFRDSLLSSLFGENRPWPSEFLKHLTEVIGTIGAFGNAIIVGRGANFILPKERTFRVRIVAPMEYRVKFFMEDRGYSKLQAEQYVIKTENDRKAFMRKHFNADVADPGHYDMIINTGSMSLDGAVEAIVAAFRKRKDLNQAGNDHKK
ncbi:MAG: cytidylate kinase-like family protein [Deltaproteobacteria bacterium]|nr:cytidylate kinase-like family protein [Deltaproteobacteria bacterium]